MTLTECDGAPRSSSVVVGDFSGEAVPGQRLPRQTRGRGDEDWRYAISYTWKAMCGGSEVVRAQALLGW